MTDLTSDQWLALFYLLLFLGLAFLVIPVDKALERRRQRRRHQAHPARGDQR